MQQTKRQKRNLLALARDILKQMRGMDVQRGSYCTIKDPKLDALLDKNIGKQLQDFIPKLINRKRPCKVCARGALFLSQVAKVDKFKVPVYISVSTIQEYQDDYIGADQAALIEAAFEQNAYYTDKRKGINPWVGINAVQFGRLYPNPRKRLRAVFKNIIKNKGEFKPWHSAN
jgi:hypothetical protein